MSATENKEKQHITMRVCDCKTAVWHTLLLFAYVSYSLKINKKKFFFFNTEKDSTQCLCERIKNRKAFGIFFSYRFTV